RLIGNKAEGKERFSVPRLPAKHFFDIAAGFVLLAKKNIYPGPGNIGRNKVGIRFDGKIDIGKRLPELVHPIERFAPLEAEKGLLFYIGCNLYGSVTGIELLYGTRECVTVSAFIIRRGLSLAHCHSHYYDKIRNA